MRIVKMELDYEHSEDAYEDLLREVVTIMRLVIIKDLAYSPNCFREAIQKMDDQLAALGLEIVRFDDGSDDLYWRIEKRIPQEVKPA